MNNNEDPTVRGSDAWMLARSLEQVVKPIEVDLDALAARPGRYMGIAYKASFVGLRNHFESTRPHWTAAQLDAEATRQADAACYVKGAPKPDNHC